MVGQGLDYIWLIGYLADSCLRNRVAGKSWVGFAQGVEMGQKKLGIQKGIQTITLKLSFNLQTQSSSTTTNVVSI